MDKHDPLRPAKAAGRELRLLNAFNTAVILLVLGVHVQLYCTYENGAFVVDPSQETKAYWLSAIVLFGVVVAMVEMFYFGKPAGETFWQRYNDSPGAFLLGALVFPSMVAMGLDVAQNVVKGHNTIESVFNATGGTFANAEAQQKERVFYWLHVVGNGIPMLLVPLQFVPQIRRFSNYLFHRWNGRLVLLCGSASMLGAFGLLIVEQSLTPLRLGMDPWGRDSIIYTMVMGLLAILTLVCIYLGGYYGVKRDIRRHAEWMHRLIALWLAGPISRMYLFPSIWPLEWIQDFVGTAQGWMSLLLSYLVPLILVEIYILKSGRFELMDKQQDDQIKPSLDTDPETQPLLALANQQDPYP